MADRKKSTRKVRVGRLSMPSFAAAKPVGIGPGRKFLTADDVLAAPTLSTPLASLEDADQARLVHERYRLEPDFTLGIVQYGNVKKAELLQHIKKQTLLGQMAILAELNYVGEMLGTLRKPMKPAKPAIPTIKAEPIPKDWKWIQKKWWPLIRATALFCENTTDSVTGQAAAYRMANVHPVFKKRGFNVVVLKGTDDVQAEFESRAKSKRVAYISGIGHGNPTTYTGHLNSPILKVGQYDPAEVDGKSIHFLSCQTAKQLSMDTVKHGALSYAGYHENFTFVWNESKRFWDADSTYDIEMATGKTADQATKATISRFNHHIAQVPGTAAATWLTWDRNWLRTPSHGTKYGKKTGRIFPFLAEPFLELEESIAALAA